MPFFLWSKTPAANATADPTIGWAEGQAPSSVNDSARAMMARLKEWGDDISGTVGTGGTGNAYTLTTNQVFTALQAGLFVSFAINTTNGAVVTLNVDGLGAKPLRSQPGTAGELGAGVLVQGTPYKAAYFTSNGGEWILHGFYGNPFNVPVAGGMTYFGASAPNSNFAFPVGQAISRTTYATLFSIIGTTYGGGDGSTTFNLPDMRGRIPVCLDNMGGSTANRLSNGASGGLAAVRHTLGGAGGEDAHTVTTAEMPSHLHSQTAQTPSIGFSGTSATLSGSATALISTISPSGPTFVDTTADPSPGDTGSAGSGNAHNNIQPSFMVNLIMRII